MTKTKPIFFSWARSVVNFGISLCRLWRQPKLYCRVWIMSLRGLAAFAMLGIVSLVSLPIIALADNCPAVGPPPAGVNCYTNPIQGVGTFADLVTAIAKAVVTIGVPIAGAAIIFVGVRFVIAAASGNQAALAPAKKMLWYVLIGTVIIVGGGELAQAVVKLVTTTVAK